MNDINIDILNDIPNYIKKIKSLRDILLANLVMISEIPAPTFYETDRMKYLRDKFSEYDLKNCSTDEKGNALGILPGSKGDKNILVVSHMDSLYDHKMDQTISIEPDRVTGPGVGDNALGLASIATLPIILDELGIKLKSNLVLMGSSRSLGRGNIEGLRFFLNNSKIPISTGICVEGVKLGRISNSSIGMMRCEIKYKVPEEYDWTRFGAVGAIYTINEVINKILEIPLPKRPKTAITLVSVEAGNYFTGMPTEAVLRLEIRSESGDMVKSISQNIKNIAAEISSQTGAQVKFNVYAQSKPGGIEFSHPLASVLRDILKKLKLYYRITPSTSELSAFIDKKIPAVTIGISDGENMHQKDESIKIEPIYKGMAQLIALIYAIDKGYCNEN